MKKTNKMNKMKNKLQERLGNMPEMLKETVKPMMDSAPQGITITIEPTNEVSGKMLKGKSMSDYFNDSMSPADSDNE